MLSKNTVQSVENAFTEMLVDDLANGLLGEKIPVDIDLISTGETIIPAGRKINRTLLRKLVENRENFDMYPSPIRNWIRDCIAKWSDGKYARLVQELQEMERMGKIQG
jgi:DNA-directed RNA polymerase subunit beta